MLSSVLKVFSILWCKAQNKKAFPRTHFLLTEMGYSLLWDGWLALHAFTSVISFLVSWNTNLTSNWVHLLMVSLNFVFLTIQVLTPCFHILKICVAHVYNFFILYFLSTYYVTGTQILQVCVRWIYNCAKLHNNQMGH